MTSTDLQKLKSMYGCSGMYLLSPRFSQVFGNKKCYTVKFKESSAVVLSWSDQTFFRLVHKITSEQALIITISGCESTGGNIDNCCSTTNLCGLHQGNCQNDDHCTYDLICGMNNCGNDFPVGTNCCRKPFPCNGTHERTESCCSNTNLCTVNQGNCEADGDCIGNLRCGKNNCGSNFPKGTNCCYKPPTVGGISD